MSKPVHSIIFYTSFNSFLRTIMSKPIPSIIGYSGFNSFLGQVIFRVSGFAFSGLFFFFFKLL